MEQAVGTRHRAGWRGLIERAVPVAALLSWFYLAVLGSLVVWTVSVTVLFGWRPLVVDTADGADLDPGDVLMIAEAGGDALGAGAVVRLEDPERPGAVQVRKVGEMTPEGHYLLSDRRTVQPAAVTGVARMLVPALGAPAVWVRQGRPAPALAAAALTGLAALLALRPAPLPAQPSASPGASPRWTVGT